MSMDSRLLVNTMNGNGKAEPEDQQEQVAVRCAAHGQHVVQRHGDVGDHDDLDRLPEALCFLAVLVFGHALHEELDRDPEDEHAAGELHIVELQQLGHEEREDDAQQHGRSGAEDDAFLALLLREGSGPPWR